jgi:hypothetical protein
MAALARPRATTPSWRQHVPVGVNTFGNGGDVPQAGDPLPTVPTARVRVAIKNAPSLSASLVQPFRSYRRLFVGRERLHLPSLPEGEDDEGNQENRRA